MTALVYILVIGLAAVTMITMMYFVMKEQHRHDAHLKYRRSPWDEPSLPADAHTDSRGNAASERTAGEALVEPLVGADSGDPVPPAEPAVEADSDSDADKPDTAT